MQIRFRPIEVSEHKTVFDVLEFPKFDPKDSNHKDLVKIGRKCEESVNNELKKMIKDNPNILTNKQNGIVRTGIRKLLSKEYNDIEKCIKKL